MIHINDHSKTSFENCEFTSFGAVYPTQWQYDSMCFKMLPLGAEVGQWFPSNLSSLSVEGYLHAPLHRLPNVCSLILLLPALGNKLTHCCKQPLYYFLAQRKTPASNSPAGSLCLSKSPLLPSPLQAAVQAVCVCSLPPRLFRRDLIT